MKYDLIIIGMGISGITSAIYASNNNLNILVLEKEAPGGLLNKISTITNYPGFSKISGPELSYKLYETIENKKINYKIEEVIDIKLDNEQKKVITNKNEYLTDYLILASGRKTKELNLEDERELRGKGISNCAICDGHIYKDKEIALVGGGDSAIEEAIYLSGIVKKIFLIHRRNQFSASSDLVQKLKEKNNIEYFMNSKITKINKENDKLSSIIINNKEELKVAALFTYIGFDTNNDYLANLNLVYDNNYIKVDKNYETNVKGIYAVGDCIKKNVYQLITAGSDGAVAAISVIKEINNKK